MSLTETEVELCNRLLEEVVSKVMLGVGERNDMGASILSMAMIQYALRNGMLARDGSDVESFIKQFANSVRGTMTISKPRPKKGLLS
jgi:hypothetical protein